MSAVLVVYAVNHLNQRSGAGAEGSGRLIVRNDGMAANGERVRGETGRPRAGYRLRREKISAVEKLNIACRNPRCRAQLRRKSHVLPGHRGIK